MWKLLCGLFYEVIVFPPSQVATFLDLKEKNVSNIIWSGKGDILLRIDLELIALNTARAIFIDWVGLCDASTQ